MPTASFEAHLAATAERVETALDAVLSGRAAAGERRRPDRLVASMRHAALGGGKRLRPALTLAVADLFGATGEGPLRAGLAVECVHAYSLVHDDLPAMDDDDMRRGRPTAHRAFDEATAILAGDALQSLAFDILADPATDPDAAVRSELVLTLARAAGLGGMAGGQMLDLAAEGRFGETGPQALGEAEVLELQAMKTGALIEAAAGMGAILGRADAARRSAITTYARALGAAFQIADDLLDAEGESAAVGKATGKDADAGKATLIGLLGLAGARARLDDLTTAAFAALEGFGPDADLLRQGAAYVAARRS
ncbi:polyprenyl synthetase family protein [Methylopila sp. M107]|uniref:polyprenyl synthetase family protein n=1 Tax=Methylopila sp. M107 TaxID=1101190 RepID=UPI00036F7B29|nr:farnesyl diphosphate synthase [Methylopila sp. M107]